MIYAIGALAVIALIALIIVAMGRGKNVTSAPGGVQREDSNITTAPPGKPGPSGIMTAPPGQPGTPEKTPDGVTKPKPPQEVVDYLAFVKQVEAVRCEAIVKSDLDKEAMAEVGDIWSKMLDMSGDAGASDKAPLQGITDKLNRRAAAMLILLKTFDKAPAPPECRQFSGAYRRLLYTETKTLYDVAAGLGNVQAANKDDWLRYEQEMKSKQQDADVVGASNGTLSGDADRALNALVGQYDMQKPFDVSAEKPSGNIMAP